MVLHPDNTVSLVFNTAVQAFIACVYVLCYVYEL